MLNYIGNQADYIALGYPSRDAYLRSLAADYGVPSDVVFAMADMLGPNEDFDGLVSELDGMGDDFN